MSKLLGGGSDNGAAEARAREEQRQADIRQGATNINTSFDNQFTPDYYGGIEDAYMQYVQPDFTKQMEDARKQLTLALATTGNLQSSVAAQRKAELDRQIQQAELQLSDRARNYSTQRRGDVESARSSLLAQNTATADPVAAANNAATRAHQFSQMPTFDPLTAMFADVTQGLATQRDLEDRQRNRYTLFNSEPGSTNSGRLVK